MKCPKCKIKMICEYSPYPPTLPYWERATLYKCPKCLTEWLKVDQTYEFALIDACFGKDVIPNGLYRWNGADTLPNLIKRKEELWEKRIEMSQGEHDAGN